MVPVPDTMVLYKFRYEPNGKRGKWKAMIMLDLQCIVLVSLVVFGNA
jgi:hypothetical protein